MGNDKDLLRIWLKKKRLAMKSADVKNHSAVICQKLIAELNWQNIKTVHCYTAIGSLNEVDTARLFEFMKTEQPHIKVFQQGKDSLLPVKTWSLDLVIVPTLGFDLRGNRIGWGGGFYDRFLSSRPRALKVGLGYETGFVKSGLPAEEYDISLNFIITEARLLKFPR